MKLLLCSVTLTLTFFSNTLLANQHSYYGGQGMGALNTVAAIQSAGPYIDDAQVSLTGKLGQQVGEDYFQFSDGTGTITIEIDHEDLWRMQIKPNTRVMIYGEVDFEGYGATIDVDMIRRAQ